MLMPSVAEKSKFFLQQIKQGNLQPVKAIITRGEIDPNITDDDGRTPLMIAASLDGDRTDIVEVLLQDLRTDYNANLLVVATAYNLALLKGNKAVAELLSQRGAVAEPFSRHQDSIRKKIITYLTLKNDVHGGSLEDLQELVNKFVEGYCSGISSLWVYSRWLVTQPKTSDKPRDDYYTWFRETVDFIATWQKPDLADAQKLEELLAGGKYNQVKAELDKLSKEQVAPKAAEASKEVMPKIIDPEEAKRLRKLLDDRERFERFIGLIEYFQHIGGFLPIAQGELGESLEDTIMGKNDLLVRKKMLQQEINILELQQGAEERIKSLQEEIIKLDLEIGREPHKEYAIASLFTLGQLKMLLNPDPAKKGLDIIQEGKLILISSHNHDTALFKKGGYYYYFNPNSVTGEVVVTSAVKLAELIFDANFGQDNHLKPSPLAIRIFSFDKVPTPYPVPGLVLDTIDKTRPLTLEPVQEEDLVDEDINFGGLKSIRPKKKLYADGYSGLMIAADTGSLESVKYFLAKGADPNVTKTSGISPLMLAAKYGYLDVFTFLLDYPRTDVTKCHLGHTALDYAVAAGMADIVVAFITNKKFVTKLTIKDNYASQLRLAAEDGRFAVIETLFNVGAAFSVDVISSAMQDATRERHPEIVKLLSDKLSKLQQRSPEAVLSAQYGKQGIFPELKKTGEKEKVAEASVPQDREATKK